LLKFVTDAIPHSRLDRPKRSCWRWILPYAAAELLPAARAAYLARACAGDDLLRNRIETLLQAGAEADPFFAQEPLQLALGTDAALRGGPAVAEGPGQRIGHYKLLERIGEGGCGVVYVAEQAEPVRRRVAIKIVKLGMDTRSVVARFEAERQALAVMDHPNIAKVFDAGATETGRPYFVMELVRGIRITDFCDQSNLRPEARLRLFLQVCYAIQHAHQKGIIHRDVKPSNVLVTDNDGVPVPKVIDFGIAKATTQQWLTDKTLYTAFDQFLGTPTYASPEQAAMTSLDIDTRSDIYGLGVLLYELLTGRTPFDLKTLASATLEEMQRIIREKEPPRPSTRLHALSAEELTLTAERRGTEPPKLIHMVRGDLDWIVMKCLEKDRTRRYESAAGLARDIERHLAHEPVVARPPSTAYRAEKFARRNRGLVLAAAAVAAALLLGMVTSVWQAIRATANERQAIAAQAELNNAAGAQLLKEGQPFAALPWLVEALRLEQGQPGEHLQRLRLGMVLQQCPELVQLWFHSNAVSCAAFSPNGQHIATGTGPANMGEVQVWDVQTGLPMGKPVILGGGISQLRFSPDGRWIAAASSDGSARVWAADLDTSDFPLLSHSDAVLGLAFSRDGNLLATASRDKTARVWNVRTGEPLTGPLPHPFSVGNAEFSPDGQRLVTVSVDGLLRVWDIQLGTTLFVSDLHRSHYLTGIQWSPDGSNWVTGSFEMAAKLWDAHRGEVIASLGHEAGVNTAGFSPDGQRVVTASTDKTARVWNGKSGTPVAPPIEHDGEVCYAEFSPDGLAIVTASSDQTARVWDAATGQPLTPSLAHHGQVNQALFSPDGRHVLTASSDGTARLWDLAVGGPSLVLEHPLPVTRLAFSPDESRLLAASLDGTVQLWDLRTGDRVGLPVRHVRAVSEAAFSRDGGRFLTASYDRTAQVWETATGKPIGSVLRHLDAVVHAAFSPDGRCLATAAKTGASVQEVWHSLQDRPRTAPRSATAQTWHRRALAQALQQQQAFAARFHLESLQQLHPGDESLSRMNPMLNPPEPEPTVHGDWFVEARSRIPPQEPGTSASQIDLSEVYTGPLTDAPHTEWPTEVYNLSSLRRGTQALDGVLFDVRGWVRLLGSYREPGRFAAPEHILGIKIARPCQRLHFLHGTGWLVDDGAEIGRYVIYYADGGRVERPIRYGFDVRNFVYLADSELANEHPDAHRAWTGSNALSQSSGGRFRLYRSVWENPRPDVPIATIDFVSMRTACHPFLIAITADPADREKDEAH
jgi:eukaryotic-like serine/threonine-protein kinase